MPDEKPNRKIFISYRRDDHPDFVARIRDWFMYRYDRENVFMDFDSIPRFVPFADFIRETVEECDVLIAVIGPRWMELMQQKAAAFQDDYVRIEIGLALQSGKLVAPICIKAAPIPSREALPLELRSILDTNVARLESDNTFYDNIERIMQDVEHALDWRRGVRRKSKSADSQKAEPELTQSPEAEVVNRIIDEVNRSPLPPEASSQNKKLAESKFTSEADITALTEAILLDPRYISAYNNRGAARQMKGDLDGAIADYTQAIRLNPRYTSAYSNRGVARKDKGDLNGAIADYTEVIRLNPEFADAYNNRAEVYFVLQEFDKALADFQRADELRSNSPETLSGLAITHHVLGDVEEARRLWQGLVDMDARYKNTEWVRKQSYWAESLVEEAWKVIARL